MNNINGGPYVFKMPDISGYKVIVCCVLKGQGVYVRL